MRIPDKLCPGLVEEYRTGTTKRQIFNMLGCGKAEITEFNESHRICFEPFIKEHLKNYQIKYGVDVSSKDKDFMDYKDHLKKAGLKLNKYDRVALERG